MHVKELSVLSLNTVKMVVVYLVWRLLVFKDFVLLVSVWMASALQIHASELLVHMELAILEDVLIDYVSVLLAVTANADKEYVLLTHVSLNFAQ